MSCIEGWSRITLRLSTSLLAMTFVASAAHGQTAPAQPQEGELQDIIVTATKRSQSVNDIGVAVSTLTEDTLTKRGLDSFEGFASSVPGLSFAERGSGQSQITLRGISGDANSDFSGSSVQASELVGIYLDETSIAIAGFNPAPKLFDISRVEVLKGPQGTLFGAGSLSGTIRYITNAPDLSRLSARLDASGYATKGGGASDELNAYVNIPIVQDRIALRVTGFQRHLGGYVDNLSRRIDPRNPAYDGKSIDRNVNYENAYGGRAQLLVKVSDDFKLIGRAYYQHTYTGGYNSEDRFIPTLPYPAGGSQPFYQQLGNYQQSRIAPDDFKTSFKLFSLDADANLGFANLTSVTSYFDAKILTRQDITDNLPAFLLPPPLPAPNTPEYQTVLGELNQSKQMGSLVAPQRQRTFAQEVRLASKGGGRLDWLVGVYYENKRRSFSNVATAPGFVSAVNNSPALAAYYGDQLPLPPGLEFITQSDTVLKQYQISGFAEVGYKLFDVLRVVGGLRYFKYDQKITFNGVNAGFLSTGAVNHSRVTEDGFNPKVSVELRPAPNTLIFATVSKGFRLGGAEEPLPATCGRPNTGANYYQSDHLWGHELGAKVGVNRHLQINGSVFYNKWSDVPSGNALPCGFTVTNNAGGLRSYGAEGDISWAAAPGLMLSGSFAYTESNFTKAAPSLNIQKGTRAALTPRWTFTANATYERPISASLKGYINANYTWRDESYNLPNEVLRQVQPSYSMVSARIGVENERWGLAIFSENLTNTHAITYIDWIFNTNRPFVSRPRTIGINGTVNF